MHMSVFVCAQNFLEENSLLLVHFLWGIRLGKDHEEKGRDFLLVCLLVYFSSFSLFVLTNTVEAVFCSVRTTLSCIT